MHNTSISFLKKNHFNDFNFLDFNAESTLILFLISVIWRDFNKMKMLLYFCGKIQASL